MFIPVFELIVLGIGCVLLVMWLYLFMVGKKYDQIFEGLDENKYAFKDLYSSGYALLAVLKYDFKSQRDRKLRQEIEILYGKKYTCREQGPSCMENVGDQAGREAEAT